MKQRQISLEILRILCMLSIVAGHIGNRSAIVPYELSSFSTIAPHCVDCFFIISGYFLINSRFKSERILKIAAETIFYSFTVTVVFFLLGQCDIIQLLKSLTPIYGYWFVNKYLAVILLSPFICKLCTSINKRMYQILIVSLLLIGSTLFKYFPFGILFGDGFSLLWVITIFITGGYIRLHLSNRIDNWGIITIILLIIYNLCRIYAGAFINLGYNSLITYALAITTFMWFNNLKISGTGIIAKSTMFIAPHVFAAYLIHEQGLMRVYIIDLLHKFQGYMPDMLYLYLFGIIVIIISALIDKVRLLLFKHCGIDYITSKIATRINKFYES